MKILVAGASGAVGRPLLTLLQQAGHTVWGLAQRPESLKTITALGAKAVQVNVLDKDAVFSHMAHIAPDIVIDQLTSLPASPFDLPQRLPADRKLRLEGGAALFEAAQACNVQRYIQQSCGFYLDGQGSLATEDSPFRLTAPGTIGDSAGMYNRLEKRVQSSQTMEGIALRYGFFYGPHTWYWPNGAFSEHLRKQEIALIGAARSVFSFVHVEDAAKATLAALTAPAGVYNVVDSAPATVHDWLPAYARWVDAPAPPALSEAEAHTRMGEESVYYQNSLSGACHKKALSVLGFAPRTPPWRLS